MKNILFLTLDHGELVDDLFRVLSKNRFNATVLSARSIKHLLEDEQADDVHFINLSHLEKHIFPTSTFCYFLVDEEQLGTLKNLIREETDSFKKIKGAMFSMPLSDYEGTF